MVQYWPNISVNLESDGDQSDSGHGNGCHDDANGSVGSVERDGDHAALNWVMPVVLLW